MRRNAWIFAWLLGFSASAEARSTSAQATVDKQVPATPRLEIAGTVGVIEARPEEIDVPYYQDWYSHGRYAGSIGYYWTRNLKTEFEHAWSGEGSRDILNYTPVNGQPFPYQTQQFFQLQQSTLRVVWQFRDNQWVHPYLSAGAVIDIEHQRFHVPVMYQPNPRGGVPVLVSNASDYGDRYKVRGGVSIGGGAKIYMTQRAFFNTGAIVTYSKHAGTVNLVAGFGIDF